MTPEGYSLQAMIVAAERTPKVRRADVKSGDRLLVKTRNSVYTIAVGQGGFCTVSGGWFDRRGKSPMRTTVAGCTWGGSIIKVDLMAAIGLCIEFGNRLITTEARRIILIRRETLN
ncbi:MAG TPA: hypothetical protein VJO14_07850 [Bacteroidota bacterium]|nr:hypothetical protein [Bacteroidota bacterium]